MLQKTHSEISFISEIDNINVQYKRDFLTSKKADKYYEILDNLIKNISNQNKRVSISYGDHTVCNVHEETHSWDSSDDIQCQIIRVMKHKVEKLTNLPFNFVLINRYPMGFVSMGKHRDKEESLGKTPTIAGISLGAVRDIQFESEGFFPKEVPKKISFSLDHGSIYVMGYPTNNYWTHEIPKRTKVYGSRISLTFRYVHTTT